MVQLEFGNFPEFVKKLNLQPSTILRYSLAITEVMELTKKFDIKFHLGTIRCIDINDKYLVSGS